jgi:hypothetical protein
MKEIFLSFLMLFPANPSVVADDSVGGYRVTGEMYLDQSFSGSQNTKKVAATCKDCRWVISNYCKRESPYQVITSCDLPILGCETDLGGGVKMRIWRQVSIDEPWQDLGIVCIGPKGPITPSVVSESIKEQAVIFLPPLNPTSQPTGQALNKLPVYFTSNQSAKFGPSKVKVAGFEVELIAYPTWTWQWNENEKLITQNPGGLFPSGQISHTWNKSGTYPVVVTTRWRAEWQLADQDFEPPTLATELAQRSSIFLQIRPAWGQLTR